MHVHESTFSEKRRIAVRCFRRLVILAVSVIIMLSTIPTTPAAAAVSSKCSGPYPTGPFDMDTMRVCITWSSGEVWGNLTYFSSRHLPPHDAGADMWVERNGDGLKYGLSSDVRRVQPNEVHNFQTRVIGNVSGPQAYVVKATAYGTLYERFEDDAHSPLVVA